MRGEMVLATILFGLAGPAADILYTKDWWHPLTVMNTNIGIEAFLVGGMIGGIASVIYDAISKSRLVVCKKSGDAYFVGSLLVMLGVALALFFGSFYLLNLNSFHATIVALLIPTLFIYIRRPYLIRTSIWSSAYLLLVAIVVYTALEFLTPGWIDAFWVFKNVPPITVFNVPLDDIAFYLLAGAFIGPLYEFCRYEALSKVSLQKAQVH